jgi:hypothetical protein
MGDGEDAFRTIEARYVPWEDWRELMSRAREAPPCGVTDHTINGSNNYSKLHHMQLSRGNEFE